VSSLAEFVTAKAGNSKLIKGKMHNAPRADLHQGFSASGADVWSDSFEYDTEGVVISAVGARCGKAFFAKGKWVAVASSISSGVIGGCCCCCRVPEMEVARLGGRIMMDDTADAGR
jgi:hypothetical protein